jgi:hypothetical protein
VSLKYYSQYQKKGDVLKNGFKTIPLAFFQKLAQIGLF